MIDVASRALSATGGIAALPKLGVGLLYNSALPGFFASDVDAVDYVEVIPDMFWLLQQPGPGRRGHGSPLRAGGRRYEEIAPSVAVLDALAERRQVVAHSIGLSIASADWFDREHVEQIAAWQRRYRFPWHSDHLSFTRISLADHGGDATEAGGAPALPALAALNVGMAAPVPYDDEVLQLVAARVARVQERVPAPFLLENNVNYVEIPEQEMSEPEFLNRLCGLTGCGLLLDVHNVYVNARNHGFDPAAFVAALDLARVVEVHVAGGNEVAGMYADSHSGPCPEPVWALLRQVVAGAPNLCGITFEFHASYYDVLGPAGIRAELDRARTIWGD
jgi:uncharacterized protein